MNEEKDPQEKKEEKAGQAQEAPLAQVPDSVVFIRLAESLRLKGQYEEAIETCKEGLKKMPDALPGRLLLGRCYLERGMIPEAKAELETVAQKIEECLPVYKLLSQVYLEEKDVDKALEVLRKTLYFQTADDSSAKRVTPLEMGLLHRGASPPFAPIPPRSREPAREDSPKVEEEKGGKATIQTDTLAEIYVKQGHLDRALVTYQEILAKEPGNEALREKYEALKKQVEKEHQPPTGSRAQTQLEKWLAVLQAKNAGPSP